jgi:hypothetical protein
MTENKKIRTVYIVEKFIPGRCPKCVSPFRTSKDFGMFAATQKSAKHFTEALAQQGEVFPEIGPKIVSSDRGMDEIIENMSKPPKPPQSIEDYAKDFIICNHCENVTLRVKLGQREVFTEAEAKRLIDSEGFNCWTKGKYSSA